MQGIRIGAVWGVAVLSLAGCAVFQPPAREPGTPPQSETAGVADAPAPPPVTAATVEDFDTTSAEQRRAAAATPAQTAAEEALGTTIASLGDPAMPGFWAETPLVSDVRQGRLRDPATGQSVAVELRPSGAAAGSGTRVSLPAMRLLGVPLTSLLELEVIGL